MAFVRNGFGGNFLPQFLAGIAIEAMHDKLVIIRRRFTTAEASPAPAEAAAAATTSTAPLAIATAPSVVLRQQRCVCSMGFDSIGDESKNGIISSGSRV